MPVTDLIHPAGMGDPIGPLLVALVLVLAAAKVGSEIVERFGQPGVLGELLGGVVLGNLSLLWPGFTFFGPLRGSPVIAEWAVVVDRLAQLGVIVLLFQAGLASTVRGMMRTGGSALLVALLGNLGSLLLGYAASAILIRRLPAGLAAVAPAGFSLEYVHLFIGALISATSVGITARVLRDLGKLQSSEGQIILGASVLDDVFGLIILAVVSAVIRSRVAGEQIEAHAIAWLAVAAIAFLGGSIVVGVWLVPRIVRQLARLRTGGVMLIAVLTFAFGMSYLSTLVGLAPIVGAFAAGLILEDSHFHAFRAEWTVSQLLEPVAGFLTPIFFVVAGMQVHLETFADGTVLILAAGLVVASVLGKQFCRAGVLDRTLNRRVVGAGMIPRGEVVLIFAGIGRGLKVIDDAAFSAVVLTVLVTSVVTPPLLKLALTHPDRGKSL